MIFNKLFNDYSNNNIGGLTDELKCIYIANNFKENTIVYMKPIKCIKL